ARPRPWPRRSPHDRNSVSTPAGGPPLEGSANSAWASSNSPATFHRRGIPGAVVVGEPTSSGWSRKPDPGRHTSTCGPEGSIVAATSPAKVPPVSNACPVQGRDLAASPPPSPRPSAAGATSANGPRGRAGQVVVAERQP